jgi:integrase
MTGSLWRARFSSTAAIAGTFHMLRHFFVTALIQSGVNAKVAQTFAIGSSRACWI